MKKAPNRPSGPFGGKEYPASQAGGFRSICDYVPSRLAGQEAEKFAPLMSCAWT